MKELINEFLEQKRIAVAGVSRRGDMPGNIIYRKLRSLEYQVYAINPNSEEAEGDRCYPDLSALPKPADGLIIATHPDQATGLVRQCHASGISRVWFHRSIGEGSYSDEAASMAEQLGISAIKGGCPMMYCQPVDIFHKCLRWVAGYPGL